MLSVFYPGGFRLAPLLLLAPRVEPAALLGVVLLSDMGRGIFARNGRLLPCVHQARVLDQTRLLGRWWLLFGRQRLG